MQTKPRRKPPMRILRSYYAGKRSARLLTDQPKMPARKLGQRGRISR